MEILKDIPISECKFENDTQQIKKLILVKRSDFIYDDNGNIVKRKRKYGKFNREDSVIVLKDFTKGSKT